MRLPMGLSSFARLLLVTALALASALGTPRQASAKAPVPAKSAANPKKQPPKPKTVTLYHLNRRETMTLRLRDQQGRPVKGLQKRFDRFLRCHYTNKQHAMNPRLVRLLYQTGQHWPGKRIEVVSGFRNPTVAKNPHSPHMKGLACDFRVVGVKNTELRDYLRGNMKKVGVGYYPNSSFVHLDVRKDRSAFWIDYSGPGERSQYSQNAAEDLKTGRAETYRPTKIDNGWIDDAPGERPEPAGGGSDSASEKKPPAGAVQGASGNGGTTLAGKRGPGPQTATP
jgi:uncharacterized protein YcbK (DUF882 family)